MSAIALAAADYMNSSSPAPRAHAPISNVASETVRLTIASALLKPPARSAALSDNYPHLTNSLPAEVVDILTDRVVVPCRGLSP